METLADKIANAIERYHVLFMRKKVLKTVEEIEATSDPLEKYIAGAGTVGELYNKLTSQLPDDVKLITEGSGANTKYYIQAGADTASKKLLRSTPKVIGSLWSPNETKVSFLADDDYDNVFVCTNDIRTGYLRLKINDILASVTETTLISSAGANRPAGIVTINQKIHAGDTVSVQSIGGGALCFFIA